MTDPIHIAVRARCPITICEYPSCCERPDRTDYCVAREGAANLILTALTVAGYAIVPKEPTEKMLNAGATRSDAVHSVYSIYRAMLAEAEVKQP